MPYDPGVVDRSGEILAQGISGGMKNLGDAIERIGDIHRELKGMRTTATDVFGMDKDEVNHMSYNDLKGQLQTQTVKSMMAERSARMADIQSQTDQRAAMAQQRQAEAARMMADQGHMDDYNQRISTATQPSQGLTMASMMADNPGMGADPMAMMRGVGSATTSPTVRPALTPDVITRTMSEANLNPDQQLKQAQAYKMMGAAGMGDVLGKPAFTEDPVSGARVVTYGKDMQPSGMNPEKVKAPPTYPVLDPVTGEPTGAIMAMHPNGKGITVVNSNASRNNQADMSALVEGEKAIQGIDKAIGLYNGKLKSATDDPKTYAKPDPSVLADLQARRSALKAALARSGGGAPEGAAFQYKSATDVRAAFQAGKLSKAEATKILQAQFGLK